jgi:hypothetical protein
MKPVLSIPFNYRFFRISMLVSVTLICLEIAYIRRFGPDFWSVGALVILFPSWIYGFIVVRDKRPYLKITPETITARTWKGTEVDWNYVSDVRLRWVGLFSRAVRITAKGKRKYIYVRHTGMNKYDLNRMLFDLWQMPPEIRERYIIDLQKQLSTPLPAGHQNANQP